MKNVLLLFFATLMHIGYSQCLDPVITNFECGTPSQTLAGNGISSIVNPVSGGINMSANVGEYVDNGTEGWDNLLIDYGSEIDLTTNNQLSFKIYSSTSIQVLAKLEGGTAVEKWSSFSAVNTWEQFTFDFSDAVGNGNTKLVLFFNAGQTDGTTTDTYYVDDIQWSSTTNALPTIADFEAINPALALPSTVQKVSNLHFGGINTSTNVGEYTDDGTQGFDGLVIDYATTIDLSTNSQFKLKLFSPTSIQILAKLEGGTAVEKWSSESAVNTWQELTFDFSDAVGDGNTRIVLFFNAGETSGTPNDIYYIDDLGWHEAPTTCEYPLITDFECDNPSQPLTGAITTIANPASGGINTSSNVGEYTDNGTEGFDALTVDYGTEIDLTTNNQLKLKLYSPESIQILAKLEGGTAKEVYSDFSAVNTWEEFTFDFSDAAGDGNTKLVLFFNPTVTTGTTNDIYYIDDLRFASSSLSVDDFDFDVKVYPNPATDRITINSKINIEKYELMNISGKIIKSEMKKEMNTMNVDISNLSQGLYFLRLSSGNSIKTFKVIKQ